jgi:hypothetical protein
MRSFILAVVATVVLAVGFAAVLNTAQETALSYKTEGARP